jgi:peptidoglycan hydrolase-like protein with peptidoglycan-binding domain
VELNAKRGLSLTVTGEFDAATTTAVRDFQTHAGIGSDGIVGPITWKNLVWHFDYPDFTQNLCDQNPDGNGTAANWGTVAAIAQLEQAARTFTGAGPVPLGDIGFEHGGSITATAATPSVSTSTSGPSAPTTPSAPRAASPGSQPPTTVPPPAS